MREFLPTFLTLFFSQAADYSGAGLANKEVRVSLRA